MTRPTVYDSNGKIPNFVFNSSEMWHQPTQETTRLLGTSYKALRDTQSDLLRLIHDNQ